MDFKIHSIKSCLKCICTYTFKSNHSRCEGPGVGGSGRLAWGGRNWGRRGRVAISPGACSQAHGAGVWVASPSLPRRWQHFSPDAESIQHRSAGWVERWARLGQTLPILRPASSRPSFTGAGVVGWPGWLLCSEVGTFFALGAGPRAVVVDNHTPEKRALARGTRLERVIPTQTTLRTCRLTSGRLSTAGTRRGEGGKCEDRSFPPGERRRGRRRAVATIVLSSAGPGHLPGRGRSYARAPWLSREAVRPGWALSSTYTASGGRGLFATFGWRPRVLPRPGKAAPAEAGCPCLSGRWRPGATCWPEGGRQWLMSEVLLCREAWALGAEGRAFSCCTGEGNGREREPFENKPWFHDRLLL